VVSAGLREGGVNRDQAHVIVRALEALPEDLDPDLRAQAEERPGSGRGSCGSWAGGSPTSSHPR
jgi:hypothetical protein